MSAAGSEAGSFEADTDMQINTGIEELTTDKLSELYESRSGQFFQYIKTKYRRYVAKIALYEASNLDDADIVDYMIIEVTQIIDTVNCIRRFVDSVAGIEEDDQNNKLLELELVWDELFVTYHKVLENLKSKHNSLRADTILYQHLSVDGKTEDEINIAMYVPADLTIASREDESSILDEEIPYQTYECLIPKPADVTIAGEEDICCILDNEIPYQTYECLIPKNAYVKAVKSASASADITAYDNFIVNAEEIACVKININAADSTAYVYAVDTVESNHTVSIGKFNVIKTEELNSVFTAESNAGYVAEYKAIETEELNSVKATELNVVVTAESNAGCVAESKAIETEKLNSFNTTELNVVDTKLVNALKKNCSENLVTVCNSAVDIDAVDDTSVDMYRVYAAAVDIDTVVDAAVEIDTVVDAAVDIDTVVDAAVDVDAVDDTAVGIDAVENAAVYKIFSRSIKDTNTGNEFVVEDTTAVDFDRVVDFKNITGRFWKRRKLIINFTTKIGDIGLRNCCCSLLMVGSSNPIIMLLSNKQDSAPDEIDVNQVDRKCWECSKTFEVELSNYLNQDNGGPEKNGKNC